MDISCAFATSSDTPAHVQLAETLGYRRAWLYDSPALYPDVWMILTRCAERTSRIGLGPGVLVPSLRHPMVNAAAIAELADQAPGRVAVAIGAGFTGRFTLGKRPMPWRQVAEYVRCLKALLAGETAEWDGAKIRMLHLPGYGAKRPVQVPILIGADGPKANPRDEPHVAELIPFASSTGLTGTAEQVSERVAGLAAVGVTEVVYQPAGSDIERELHAFASATGLAG